MIGTFKDYQLAKQLYDQDRPLDAIKVIDRVLEFAAGADVPTRIDALMTAITSYAQSGGPGLVSTTSDLGDGKSELRIDPTAQKLAPMMLGQPMLAEILCIRAKAAVNHLQAAGDKAAVGVALDNTDLVMRLMKLRLLDNSLSHLLKAAIPDEMAADLNAIAAQPLLLLNELEHGTALLRDALALKPGHRVVLALVDMFKKQHGITLDVGPLTPAAPAAPAAPAPTAPVKKGGCGLFLLCALAILASTIFAASKAAASTPSSTWRARASTVGDGCSSRSPLSARPR